MIDTVSTSALVVSGNPTDDEIAAIASAYSFLLSRGGESAIHKSESATGLWQQALRARRAGNMCVTGNKLSWVATQRLRSR